MAGMDAWRTKYEKLGQDDHAGRCKFALARASAAVSAGAVVASGYWLREAWNQWEQLRESANDVRQAPATRRRAAR